MNKSDGNDPPTLTLNIFINMLNNLSDPWGIKSEDSRHIHMNNAARIYTDTPLNFDIEGRFDEEFPAGWSESADALKEHDRRAMNQKKQVSVIETDYWYGSNSLMPFVSEKFPVYDKESELSFIVWNAKPLRELSPIKYISTKKPSILTSTFDTDLFSAQELNLIFYLIHRYTVKEIAQIYGMSHRTIGNRVQNLYQKAEVHSFRQFEQFCKQLGLDNYIPACLIKRGVQII